MVEIKTPQAWIIHGEVGTSSRTIWGVLTGAITEYTDDWNVGVPHDIDDFKRCYKLILLFPEWKARLHEVSAIFPMWIPFIREWESLVSAYRKFCLATTETDRKEEWHESYQLVQRLHDEGRVLDGWVQTGPGSWRKEKDATVQRSVRLSAN